MYFSYIDYKNLSMRVFEYAESNSEQFQAEIFTKYVKNAFEFKMAEKIKKVFYLYLIVMSPKNHALMLFHKGYDYPTLINTLYSYSSLKIQDGRHVYCLKYRIRIFRNTMNLLYLPGVKGSPRMMNLIMIYSKLKNYQKFAKKIILIQDGYQK